MQPAIKILLVDDDPTFVYLAKRIISSTGYHTQIIECADGQEAVEFIDKEIKNKVKLPDLILLDLSMPVADGWSFLKEYDQIESRLQKKIFLYIVSSSISPHDVERSKGFKTVKDFLIKPLLKEKVLEIFQTITNLFDSQMQIE